MLRGPIIQQYLEENEKKPAPSPFQSPRNPDESRRPNPPRENLTMFQGAIGGVEQQKYQQVAGVLSNDPGSGLFHPGIKQVTRSQPPASRKQGRVEGRADNTKNRGDFHQRPKTAKWSTADRGNTQTALTYSALLQLAIEKGHILSKLTSPD